MSAQQHRTRQPSRAAAGRGDRSGRPRMSADTRRQIAEYTSKQWGFGGWSNPATAALAVYTAGTLLHLLGVAWWPVLLGGIVFTLTWVIATMAKHIRVLGIVYSASLAAAVTGWLTYAAGHTTLTIYSWPTTRDHLIAVAVGALPFGVLYSVLVHGRAEQRKADAAEQRRLVGERKFWHEACDHAGIKRWFYVAARPTAGGKAVTMRIEPGGTPLRQALALLPKLEISLKAAYHGAVGMERGADASEVVIYCNERNMLAETIMLPADTSRLSILEPVTLGLHEDRDPIRVNFSYQSTIAVGQRDWGKTNLDNVRLLTFQRMDDVLQWVVDFKEGSLARPYLAPYAAGQVQRPAFDWVATTVAEFEAMLDAADAIASGRAGRRTGDKIRPSHEQPVIRIDIDELADLTADPKNYRIVQKLIKVLRKHRSEGIDLDMSTQRTTMSFLGMIARDIGSQVGIKSVFKLSDPAEVFNTLNIDRARAGGVDPSTFEYPGSMLTIAKDVRRMPAKAYRVEDDDEHPRLIPAHVRECADRRPVLEPDAIADAGPAYARRWDTPAARELLKAAAASVGADYNPAHLRHDATVIPLHRTTTEPTIESADDRDQPTDSGQRAGVGQRSAPTGTPAGSTDALRQALIAHYGAGDGEQRWQRAEAAAVLYAMRDILQNTPTRALPTRKLLGHLTARDTARWGHLTDRSLSALLDVYQYGPGQLGAGPWGKNSRGYKLIDVEAKIARGPVDATAQPDTDGSDPDNTGQAG